MTDAADTVGHLLHSNDPGGRDAIHVAVISAIAARILYPGMQVGFIDPPHNGVDGVADNDGVAVFVGIVDPFLQNYVPKGARFWLYVFPRSTSNLHHHWSHPHIPDAMTTKTTAAAIANEEEYDECKGC